MNTNMIFGKLNNDKTALQQSFEIVDNVAKGITLELSIGWVSDPRIEFLEMDGYMEVVYPADRVGIESFEIIDNKIIVSYYVEETP